MRKPAKVSRSPGPRAASRPIKPMAAREKLDIPRSALFVNRALIARESIIRPGAEIGRIVVAVRLVAQPLEHRAAAVLESEVADHPPAGGIDMAPGGDRIGGACDIGLLVAALGHDLELAVVEQHLAHRRQVVDVVVPDPDIGDRRPWHAGRRGPGAALQIDIDPQIELGAVDHPRRIAGRAVPQIPHRGRKDVAGDKPGQRMTGDRADIDELAVEAAKFHTVINCVPYRCGSIRTKGNSSRR